MFCKTRNPESARDVGQDELDTLSSSDKADEAQSDGLREGAVNDDRRWYANLQQLHYPCLGCNEAPGKDLVLCVRRGKEASFEQDGTPKEQWVEELLKDKTWLELRESGQPSHDAADDPLSAI